MSFGDRIQATLTNIRANLIFLQTRIIDLYILPVTVCVSLNSIFLVGSVKRFFLHECVLAFQSHPRSLILAPIENEYATSY